MNMYEIEQKYREALDRFTIDPETGEVFGWEALDAVQGEATEKIEAIACYIKETAALAEAMKKEKQALEKRQKAEEARVERLKNRLAEFMEATGNEKLKTPRCQISFRSSQKLVIRDEKAIPDGYFTIKTERVPNSAAIKDFLASLPDGQSCSWAAIQRNKNIQIK